MVFLVDVLIAAALWALLAVFKLMHHLLPVGGWAGEFIEHIHSAGVVGTYGVLAVYLIWDVIRLKRAQPPANR